MAFIKYATIRIHKPAHTGLSKLEVVHNPTWNIDLLLNLIPDYKTDSLTKLN